MNQRRSRRGDVSPPPFEELVKMYSDRIFRLVYTKVGDYHDAMDIVQEIFYRAYRGYSNFRGEAQPYTWLYRIALNTTMRFLSKRKRKEVDIEMESGYSDDPQKFLEKEEEKEKVRKVLWKLSDAHRTILFLKYYEDLDYNEIADILDIPLGTVRSRLSRARTALEKLMEVEDGLQRTNR